MAVSYNFINNDNIASTHMKKKIRAKRRRRMLLTSHGVVDLASCPGPHDVEFAVQVY